MFPTIAAAKFRASSAYGSLIRPSINDSVTIYTRGHNPTKINLENILVVVVVVVDHVFLVLSFVKICLIVFE